MHSLAKSRQNRLSRGNQWRDVENGRLKCLIRKQISLESNLFFWQHKPWPYHNVFFFYTYLIHRVHPEHVLCICVTLISMQMMVIIIIIVHDPVYQLIKLWLNVEGNSHSRPSHLASYACDLSEQLISRLTSLFPTWHKSLFLLHDDELSYKTSIVVDVTRSLPKRQQERRRRDNYLTLRTRIPIRSVRRYLEWRALEESRAVDGAGIEKWYKGAVRGGASIKVRGTNNKLGASQ